MSEETGRPIGRMQWPRDLRGRKALPGQQARKGLRVSRARLEPKALRVQLVPKGHRETLEHKEQLDLLAQ